MGRCTSLIVKIDFVLVLVTPFAAVITVRAIDDRPLLHDVRSRALPLFEETARLVDPAFEPRGHPGNDPKGPL